MKKIAIPYFGERISARFDIAKHFLLVNVENGKISNRENIIIDEENPLKKIDILAKLGIDILICDVLTKFCENYLISKSIKIFSGIQGNIEDVLMNFITNIQL